MASAHKYEWERAGKIRSAWRAKWADADGRPRSRRGFPRQADALAYGQDREAEARHGLSLGGQPLTGGSTVDQWAKVWLAGLSVRDSSRASYEAALARVLSSFGGRTLLSLRASELRSWRRALGERYAVSTADQTAAIFGMLLRAAVEDGLLPKSPHPRRSGGKTEGRVVDPNELLTVEQVRAWGAAMPLHAREMPLVAATTGLRQGELLGLRLDNVNFLRRQVRVVEQLVTPQGAGQPVWGPTKTPAGVRVVPLAAPAAEALARHLERFPAVEGEPIFRGARGQRWRRGTFVQCWQRARDEARLPDDKGDLTVRLPAWAHWHGLRDVAASAWIRQGVDAQTLIAVMGHTSLAETRVYSRLWKDSEDNAREAMERAWATVPTAADSGAV